MDKSISGPDSQSSYFNNMPYNSTNRSPYEFKDNIDIMSNLNKSLRYPELRENDGKTPANS